MDCQPPRGSLCVLTLTNISKVPSWAILADQTTSRKQGPWWPIGRGARHHWSGQQWASERAEGRLPPLCPVTSLRLGEEQHRLPFPPLFTPARQGRKGLGSGMWWQAPVSPLHREYSSHQIIVIGPTVHQSSITSHGKERAKERARESPERRDLMEFPARKAKTRVTSE